MQHVTATPCCLSPVLFSPEIQGSSAWQMLGLHLTEEPGEMGCVPLLRTVELSLLVHLQAMDSQANLW